MTVNEAAMNKILLNKIRNFDEDNTEDVAAN
jgi:hypothetical protein